MNNAIQNTQKPNIENKLANSNSSSNLQTVIAPTPTKATPANDKGTTAKKHENDEGKLKIRDVC